MVVISGSHNKQAKILEKKTLSGFLKIPYRTEFPLLFTFNYLVLSHIISPL